MRFCIGCTLKMYIDDVCSESSKVLIEGHIKECEECKLILNEMNEEVCGQTTELVEEDEEVLKVLKKLNRKIVSKQIIIALMTAVIICGVWTYFSLLD